MSVRFSQSFKQQAVKKAIMREEGVSVKDIAGDLSIGYSTLQKWVLQTKNHELESKVGFDKIRVFKWVSE